MTGRFFNITCTAALLAAAPVLCPGETATVVEIDQKTEAAIRQLSREQDELQADLSDIISDQTEEKVIELLKKCRISMNDSIDLLEINRTDSETLAAQSDVIERIYQAAKQKYEGGEGGKKGSEGVMSMLRRMLGMESPAEQSRTGGLELHEQDENGNEGEAAAERSGSGQKPGDGGQSGQGGASSREGEPDPADLRGRETRTVPRSSGVGPADMPEEFRETLESYNQTLQQ